MEYDGCCSRSALVKHVVNEAENLTPEQIAAKEIETQQRSIAQRKAAYHETKRLDFVGWQATRRMYSATYAATHPGGKAAFAKKTRKKS